MVGEGTAEMKGPSISGVAAVALQIRLEILEKKTQTKTEFRDKESY